MTTAHSAPLRLGQAAAQLMEAGVPDEVDAWARRALLDTLAVTIGGRRTRVVRSALAVATKRPGSAELLIARGSSAPEWVAFALATSGNALDYDDGHVLGGGIHAGSTVLAALLASAPAELSLEQLRVALVIGYEVAIRAGILAAPERSGNDYRTSGYAAAIGAAAALAAVAGTPRNSAEFIASVIRTATAHAPVSSFVSGGARESTGWAAATAVGATELVSAGLAPGQEETRLVLPAGPTIFDSELAAAAIPNLGERFLALECYVKPYPCCRAVHAAIDVVLELARDGLLARSQTSVIELGLPVSALGLIERAPADLGEAQFAMPFLIGLAAIHGVSGLRSLGRVPLANLVQDPAVYKMIERVRMVHDPSLDGWGESGYPARVSVFEGGTTVRTRTVWQALGSPEQPMVTEQLREKALDLFASELGAQRAAELVCVCMSPTSRFASSLTLGDVRLALSNPG